MVKNMPANAGDVRDVGLIPGSGRSPGKGNGNPFYYSCLENPMDRGICWAIVHRVAKSLTGLKQLSMHPPFQRIGSLIAEERVFFFFSLMCMQLGFPGGSVGKETAFIALDAGDACLIPWSGKIPWKRAWKPTTVSLPLSIVDKGLQCMGSQSVRQN